MFDLLVKELQQAVEPHPVEIDGRTFTSRQLFALPSDPEPRTLETNTLQSLIDYVAFEIDKEHQPDSAFVHIESPTRVSLFNHVRRDQSRICRLTVNAMTHGMVFGRWYTQPEFITLLQTQFVQTPELENLARSVGSLVAESSIKLNDDGVSQQTEVKKGVIARETLKVNNRYDLAPFRTFAEVEQPTGQFVLRLQKQDGEPPLIALFESDNYRWRQEANNSIAAFLQQKGLKIPILQ